MKGWASVLAAAAVFGVPAGSAQASVPPPAWVQPTWTGPAKVCGEGFAFEAIEGETVRQGYPSVGVIRYWVETPKGRVDIAELWAASGSEISPEFEDRPGGRLYAALPAANDRLAVSYAFRPAAKDGLPVDVTFGSGGQGSWTGKDFDGVLKRIDFARIERTGCAAPDKS